MLRFNNFDCGTLFISELTFPRTHFFIFGRVLVYFILCFYIRRLSSSWRRAYFTFNKTCEVDAGRSSSGRKKVLISLMGSLDRSRARSLVGFRLISSAHRNIGPSGRRSSLSSPFIEIDYFATLLLALETPLLCSSDTCNLFNRVRGVSSGNFCKVIASVAIRQLSFRWYDL